MEKPVVDHWLWVARGFHGLVSMIQDLQIAQVPISAEAMELLKRHQARLSEIIQHVEQKG